MNKSQKGFGLGGVFRGKAYQRGFGLGGVFRGSPYQKGYGFGGLLTRFVNWVTPFFNRAKGNLMPILKSTAQTVGSEVVSSAANIAKDIIQGKDAKATAEENINKSIDKLTARQSGSGINKSSKRKNFTQLKKKKKKKRILDIFD